MAYENWMTKLPSKLRDTAIIHLAIPGSHNSMTYAINEDSRIAPDAEKNIRSLHRFFPWFVRRWAKTQNVTVTKQLEMGIRYFDLRVAQEHNEFFYVHGLFSCKINEPIIEIKAFLDKQPGEVVILDFQHFYAMNVTHHMHLHQLLLDFFGDRLFTPNNDNLIHCTLNRCFELKRQVLLIYRRCPISIPQQFWPSYVWPTPWPNVSSSQKLVEFLDETLHNRKAKLGYVSQCVLTPSGRYIALRFLSSLRKTAKTVDKKVQPWIENQKPGPFNEKDTPRVNVFIADFIDIKNGEFCNWVIGLNEKLQETENEH